MVFMKTSVEIQNHMYKYIDLINKNAYSVNIY